MRIQKLMSYDQRIQQYQVERRNFWLKEFPLVADLGALVFFGLMFGLSKLDSFAPPFNLDWRQIALLLWAGAMVAPIKMMHPEDPTRSDVARDRELRRSVGMDDSVDE